MNKLTNYLLPVVVLVVLLCCVAAAINRNDFTISGTIINLKQDTLYFERPDGTVDPIKTTNGKFTYTGKVPYPDMFTLYIDSRYEEFVRIFVENSDILIAGSADSIAKLSVTGSTSNNEYIDYRKRIGSILDRLNLLDDQQGDAINNKRMDAADSLAALYQIVADARLKDVLSYAKEHRGSKIIPYITARASIDSPDADIIREIFETLDDEAKKSPRVSSTNEMLNNLAKTSVGSPAPAFSLTTLGGKAISLSSLKGKVVLIDFWASWCGPCRLNHPNLLDVYKKYQGREFELISISLDKKEADWKKAIEKDGLVWDQYCDQQGAKGVISMSYGIAIIPSSLLIDRNGIIAAKNIHGKLLYAEIRKLIQ